MDEVFKTYLEAPVSSFVYVVFFVEYLCLFAVTILSVLKVLGCATAVDRVLLLSAFLSILAVVLRKFVPGPYTMLLFYVIIMLTVTFFFKVPLAKSFVGVIFALVLSMLSTILIFQNALILTQIEAMAEKNIFILMGLGLSEVFFNLVYVILASRFDNLNLSFMFFSEEKNAKA